MSIKISYKGKNTLLPKGVDSLQKIESEMGNRYKDEFKYGIILKYQQRIINQFQQIKDILKSTGNKNIKLEVEAAPEKLVNNADQKKLFQFGADLEQIDSMTDNFCSKFNLEKEIELQKELIRLEQQQQQQTKTNQFQLQSKIEEQKNINLNDKKLEEEIERQEEKNKEELNEKSKIEEEKQEYIQNTQQKQHEEIQIQKESKQFQEKNEQNKLAVDEQFQLQVDSEQDEQQKINKKEKIIKNKQSIQQEVPQYQQIQFQLQNKEEQKSQQKIKSNQKQCNQQLLIEKHNQQIKPIEAPHEQFQQSLSYGNSKNFYCNYQSEFFLKESKGVMDQLGSQLKQLDQGVYQCIFCKKGISCNVCDGRKTIDHNSKFIKLVTRIAENIANKRIDEKFQELQQVIIEKQKNIVEQVVKMIEKQKNNEWKNQPNKFQITDDESCVKNVNLGEQISWIFNIKVNSLTQKDLKMVIYDEGRKTIVKEMPLQRQLKLQVGPYFVNEIFEHFVKKFNLHIMRGQLTLCTRTFGFSVPILKPKLTKIASNKLKNAVSQIKKNSKQQKPIEYLMMKLSEFGITETTYDQTLKEMIEDIIGSKDI